MNHAVPPHPAHHLALDALATLVAVVDLRAKVLFANAALEDALGTSRRTIEGGMLTDYFVEPHTLVAALDGVAANAFATLRYDALLQKTGPSRYQSMSSSHTLTATTKWSSRCCLCNSKPS